MYRFLLDPRWLRLIAAALVVAAGCVLLGMWQVERLGERHRRNALIERHLAAPAVPVEHVARVGRDLSADQEWRVVEARGRYDRRRELLVRHRVFEGVTGYQVLTPLVTVSGPALLVNRGWVPAGSGRLRPDVPQPSSGLVTVVARMRTSEDAASAPPRDGMVRAIDVPAIAATLPYSVYGGYGELMKQTPASSSGPRRIPPPQVAQGPHLAYAFQWFVFGLIAVVGVAFLARREAREPAAVGRGRREPRATR